MPKIKKILITGTAGFIGFHCALKFLNLLPKYEIHGVDNFNKNYELKIKKLRNNILNKYKRFKFFNNDLKNDKLIKKLSKQNYEIIIHLAAQPGVRDVYDNPKIYFENNLYAYFNILRCITKKTKLFIYGSSSSIYGNSKISKELSATDSPLNFYAGSKKCNEIIAKSFNEVIDAKIVGLRFFTCYGPYGRPDMAVFKFTRQITKGKKINFHNFGKHLRDFTYIDDVIKCIYLIINNQQKLEKFELFNIGKEKPNSLKELTNLISSELNKKAKIKKIKAQKGEVKITRSNMNYFYKKFKYKPKTSLREGVKKFINWYKSYE